MGEQLKRGPSKSGGFHGGQAQQHKTHVRHGTKCHHALKVRLRHGDHGTVKHGKPAQKTHRRGEGHRLIGEGPPGNAHNAVAAYLEQNARQHRRNGRGGFYVGIGQPGMQRGHGHLDGKGEKQDPEADGAGADAKQRGLGGKHATGFGGIGGVEQHVEVKRVFDLSAAGQFDAEHEPDHNEQHKYAARKGVNKEFEGRKFPPGTAPSADEEEHGKEHELVADIKEEEVARGEYADEGGVEQQKKLEKGAHAVLGIPRGHIGEPHDPQREDNEHEGNAIHPEVVIDAEDTGIPKVEAQPGRTLLPHETARQAVAQKMGYAPEHEGQLGRNHPQAHPAGGPRIGRQRLQGRKGYHG